MNKKIIWGVIVMVIIAGGAYYYSQNKKGNVCGPYCPNITDQDREEIRQSAEKAQTAEQKAEWKTYKNDKYGFELSYPSYGYTTKDAYRFAADYGSYTIEFRMPSQTYPVRTQALFIEIYPKDQIEYVQNKGPVNTSVGGIPATMTPVKSIGELESRHIYFIYKDFGYDIQMTGPGFEDAEKMLSTFKFTN